MNPGGSSESWREEQQLTSWRMSFRCYRWPAKQAPYWSIGMDSTARLSKVFSFSKMDKSLMQASVYTEDLKHYSGCKDGSSAILSFKRQRSQTVHLYRLYRCHQ